LGPVDAFWHLLNFFAPVVGVGVLTSLLAKLLWRHDLRGVGWRQLCGWSTGLGALTWIAALVVFGRDGRMLGYAAMLCACALPVWWLGFAPRRD
jgi:hypothetical protein